MKRCKSTERLNTASTQLIRRLGGRIANALVVATLLVCVLLPAKSVRAQDSGATTVAILITMPEGQPTDPAIAVMKEIMAYVAKQPGFIDQTLLASKFPGNKPSHVHVSLWRSLSDWEALFGSAEFLSLLDRTGRYFAFEPAEVFQPVH